MFLTPFSPIGEDGRQAGETCPPLLVAFGGESFDETFICDHVGADRSAAAACLVAETARQAEIPSARRYGTERCLRNRLERGSGQG